MRSQWRLAVVAGGIMSCETTAGFTQPNKSHSSHPVSLLLPLAPEPSLPAPPTHRHLCCQAKPEPTPNPTSSLCSAGPKAAKSNVGFDTNSLLLPLAPNPSLPAHWTDRQLGCQAKSELSPNPLPTQPLLCALLALRLLRVM